MRLAIALLCVLALAPTTLAVSDELEEMEFEVTVDERKGKCVATRGLTGYSVTLVHCMPALP